MRVRDTRAGPKLSRALVAAIAAVCSAVPLAAQSGAPVPEPPVPAAPPFNVARTGTGHTVPPAAGGAAAETVRLFFVADLHSNHLHMERLLADIDRERPDIVLDGGDFVHDGTESEFRRAYAARAAAAAPWRIARGNHDALLRGPFTAPPPPLPAFDAFDVGHVRVVLLDNRGGSIAEPLFEQLEKELEAQAGRVVVVAMHVPALIARVSPIARLRPLAPFHVESPVMPDRAEVERFTSLMERHGVLAVFAGHTHYPDYVRRGGVHYLVAGAAGGLTPGLRVPNEYLDVTIDGHNLEVQRVTIAAPAAQPIAFTARAFRFYARLNRFNHDEQGWNYVPSASVQVGTALRRTQRGAREDVAVVGSVAFERNLGTGGVESLFADVAGSAGVRELALHLAGGYRLRPLGSFNMGPYIAGAVTGNAGRLDGSPSAGLGVQLAAGFAWRQLVLEVVSGRATNHRATSVGVAHRF